ncbi:MAG: hypothetical protein IPL53_25355 [Ignavibacteria bacterium]|nr:hypothetical protein [Ignavibacteria bacterium]
MTIVRYSKVLLFLVLATFLAGCLNVEQKTKINEDLSGTIHLHYWIKSMYVNIGDVEMGDDIGGFSFVASEIKKKYSSPFSEVSLPRRYEIEKDSTTHIEVDITFKDFNKLTEASGFSKLQMSYVKGKDGMDFRYFIPKDTNIALTYTKDWHTLEYTFEFPGEVIATNGTIENGSKEKNTAKWLYKVSDHAQNDLEFTATVKDKSGICGMFGIELPVILLFGLILFKANSGKKIKVN